MTRFWLPLLTLLMLLAPASAEARKVALVIGNSAYANTGALTNPVNDIRIVADAAKAAGFEVVTASNLGNQAFQGAMRDFRTKADGAEVAMVYFAGHGIEAQGKNWLLPVDAKLESDLDLPYEAIELSRLMEAVSGAQVRMVVLDACRNNPFGSKWRSGTRAVARGMAGVEADDVLVIFAAAPGQTASDGNGANSPFALALARRLPEPDLPVQLLGGAIRDDVLAATGGNQRPFVSASITGTPVYLVPRIVPTLVAAAPAVPTGDRTASEEIFWKGALTESSVRAFSAYLSEFPSGRYAADASDAIARLLTPSADGSAVRGGQYRVSDIVIECIKVTGFLGLPDQLFLRFGGSQRFPESKKDSYTMKKGQRWVVPRSFDFDGNSTVQLLEDDDVGGNDILGTIDLEPRVGNFTRTINGDRSEYKVTYRVSAE
ncbi:caspase family protein [Sphingopyxis sp. OPL5]|uniref:caspase family protein n=1 Tax=Sphingopyxis sp. OPL5 TaxID=2486273 RepID=UPI00164E50FE|nr:caspase family protein [Sphingopyxis sp. OPL5]QNO26434.1 caspase family protein [Sphingopyxis sp. OPL5]